MKSHKILILVALAVLAFAWMTQATEDAKPEKAKELTEVQWYEYEEGWEKAKAENKHMFIDFTATWCTWCKRLDKDTFSRPEVIKMLNEDFVPVKVWDHDKSTLDIDGYRITVKDLIKKEFRIKGYPALWFVSPEGTRIGPAGGYVKEDQFLQALDIVKHYRYDSTRTETGEKIPSPQEQ